MRVAAKRLWSMVLLIGAITATSEACDRTETITQVRTDTVIVQRPGHVDTIIVVRPDTVTRPETSFIQLPGRVDTLIRVDTTVVQKTDTMLVIKHDTVIVHDTVTHYDTVRLSREPAHICLQLPKADTLFFLTAVDTMCNGAHMTQYYPGYNVYVDIIPNASMYRGTRLLPGYMQNHR